MKNNKLKFTNQGEKLMFANQGKKLMFANQGRKLKFNITQDAIVYGEFPYTFDFRLR